MKDISMKDITKGNGYRQWTYEHKMWIMRIVNNAREMGYEETNILHTTNLRYKKFIV